MSATPATILQRDSQLLVPYVTAWSAEEPAPAAVILRPGNRGIAYRDEVVSDRDERGILLSRMPSALGHGKPKFGVVHAVRQRYAMQNLLCQVCGNSADTNDEGILWLLQDHRADWPDWPTRMGCTEPPICADCATLSIRSCPALRKGHVLVRVSRAPLAGIHGTLWDRTPLGIPKPQHPVLARFGDPLLPWVLASHLVRHIEQATLLT